MKFSISGNSAVALEFNSTRQWPSDSPGTIKRFTYVPHAHDTGAPKQSKTHTITISQCPGDFRVSALKNCWRSGSEGSIRAVVQNAKHPRYCTLKPNTRYFVNVAAINPK